MEKVSDHIFNSRFPFAKCNDIYKFHHIWFARNKVITQKPKKKQQLWCRRQHHNIIQLQKLWLFKNTQTNTSNSKYKINVKTIFLYLELFPLEKAGGMLIAFSNDINFSEKTPFFFKIPVHNKLRNMEIIQKKG